MITPRRTWALVVGIEEYEIGGPFNGLTAPAADARRFAAWLEENGVPSSQILTFISTPGDLPAGETRATQSHIEDAITNRLAAADGDLLFVYWSGHGVAQAGGGRRLFVADTTRQNLRNIDLDDMLRYLHSASVTRLERQYVFIDACGVYAEYIQAAPLPNLTLSGGLPKIAVEQWALFAASPGEVARVDPNGGKFTRALLNELRANPGEWPPNVADIKASLEHTFLEERAAGGTQTISHYWYRTGNGSRGTMSSLSNATRARAHFMGLNPDERRLLVEALAECAIMRSYDGRSQVLGDVRGEIFAMIARDSKPRVDINNIVKRCVSFSGGLAELLEAVRYYEGETSEWIRVADVAKTVGIAIA